MMAKWMHPETRALFKISIRELGRDASIFSQELDIPWELDIRMGIWR